MKQELEEAFGFMFEKELLEEIESVGVLRKYKQGDILIDYNETLQQIPLLIDGAVKIMRQDEKGDELALYYLERGDTCSMTLNCCLGSKKSEISAVAETDVIFISIPVQKMQDWMQKYQTWMAFVFESYNSRFNELLESIDNLAFNKMHERLHKYLEDKALVMKSTSLNLSHQDIANDMHTSRVVVSRLLKSLENEGLIKLGRNKIEVLDFDA
ncbi:MAG: Crp/Fnr family transcriptional regulator [Flavobacteriales bacterium]|jgi:CRP/FNR family transcriptional regulator|nr:Crp/Fnr family transcriptional regulator [Flavobacteriales bacterium]|tara:strand:- start:360 stop:998 length:639 start_codon:yes stop_codon:yes gene_type:complete